MKPLENLRDLALEQYRAGRFGSVHLADLGRQDSLYASSRTWCDAVAGKMVDRLVLGRAQRILNRPAGRRDRSNCL
jgi:hypothetical protein